MTFGIALRNEFNDNLVDVTEGMTYYLKSEGTCFSSTDLPFVTASNGLQQRYYVPFADYVTHTDNLIARNLQIGFTETFNRIRFAGATMPTIQWFFNASQPMGYVSASSNFNDIVFFKLPTNGLIRATQYICDFDEAGTQRVTPHLGAYVCMSKDVPEAEALEYKVVSTDLPASVGSHGIRRFDPSGVLTFDTTREIASFRDTISLTAAEAQSIITTGAVIDKTLRVPLVTSDIWINCDFFSNWRNDIDGSSWIENVRIRAINSTTIRFDRERASGNNTGWASYNFSSYDDAQFLITTF